ncbi:MAG: hypothetical protein ACJ8ES_16695 [Xanthobacteraceae bacterium]
MVARSLVLVALALLRSISVATSADLCCECAPTCAPAVVVKAPARVKPFYIVEQGPVYGGPHIVTTPTFETFHTRRARYPAMRQTYYYPTYRDSYLLPSWHKPGQNGRP